MWFPTEMAFELEEDAALELTELMVQCVVVVTWMVWRKNKRKDTLVKSSH